MWCKQGYFPHVFPHVNNMSNNSCLPCLQDCQQQWNSLNKEMNWNAAAASAVFLSVALRFTHGVADEAQSERFWLVTLSRCRGHVAVGRRPSAQGLLLPREGCLAQVGTKGNIIPYLSCLSKQKARLPPSSPHWFSRDWWLHGLRTINRGWFGLCHILIRKCGYYDVVCELFKGCQRNSDSNLRNS